MGNVGTKPRKLRYRWSHRHPLHRAVVRGANRSLPLIPFRLKYAVVDAVRARSLPYRLLRSGSVAVQVGAPRDTLAAGRSRAMTFVRRTQPDGRVLVIEPDSSSVDEFRRTAMRHGLQNVEVVYGAAWSKRATLTMEVDPRHPATNFTAGSADYVGNDLSRFREVKVEAHPVDELIEEAALDCVDLVSITTNGAEEEILAGLEQTLKNHRPYVCLARTRDSLMHIMSHLDYERLGEDDRGFTFAPRKR